MRELSEWTEGSGGPWSCARVAFWLARVCLPSSCLCRHQGREPHPGLSRLPRPSSLGGPRRRWSGGCRSSCPITGPKAEADTGLRGPSRWGVGQPDALCNQKSTMTENNKHRAGRETFFLATAPLAEKCLTRFPPPSDAATGGETPAQGVPVPVAPPAPSALSPPPSGRAARALAAVSLPGARPSRSPRASCWRGFLGHVEMITTLLHSPSVAPRRPRMNTDCLG